MDGIQQAKDRILSFLDGAPDEKFGWSRSELASELGIDESDVRIALDILERELKITVVVHDVGDAHVVYYASRREEWEEAQNGLMDLVRRGKVEVEEGPDGEPIFRAKTRSAEAPVASGARSEEVVREQVG